MHQHISAADVIDALQATPMLDAHTHLTGGRLAARGLHDILLYHMVVSDLYAAGCPSGARLTEYPGWPTRRRRMPGSAKRSPTCREIQNTSCFWGVRIILRDLYGWDEPITADNWERLDEMIRERADDRAWQREIIRRANINRLTTELPRRGEGLDDDILHYSMEWAFFTRTQRGEYDTALYELERCWGQPPGSPIPHGGGSRPASERVIRTLDDVHAAMDHFVGQLAADPGALACHAHFARTSSSGRSRTARWRPHWPAAPTAGPAERDIYASYIHEAFLTALEPLCRADRLPVQHCGRADAARDGQHRSAAGDRHLADMVARHPQGRDSSASIASRHAQPVAVHALPRVAEFRPGRLLVAQFLPRRHAPGDGGAAGHAARRTSRSASSPTPMHRMDLRQGEDRPQPDGPGAGAEDPAGAIHASSEACPSARGHPASTAPRDSALHMQPVQVNGANTLDILGLGCAAVDERCTSAAYPAADAKTPVRRWERHCGGLTATALVAAARLGAAFRLCGHPRRGRSLRFVLDACGTRGSTSARSAGRADARPIHSVVVVDETQHTRTILFDTAAAAEATPDWPPRT